MPAPENLNLQTPGESLTPPDTGTSTATTSTDQAPAKLEEPAKPAFAAKHNGGPRWIVIDAAGEKVGDFVGDKPAALLEVDRLAAGGEPYVAAKAPAKTTEAKPAAPAPEPAKAADGTVDPTSLKQPVMTSEGWLCPEPAAKE